MNNRVKLAGLVTEEIGNHIAGGTLYHEYYIECIRTSGTVDKLRLIIANWKLKSPTEIVGKYICVEGALRVRKESEHIKLYIYAFDIFSVPDQGAETNNLVELNGIIIKVSEYRVTPLGREICDLLISVERNYGGYYSIPCIAWGEDAQWLSNEKSGTGISLIGRFQSRNYEKCLDDGTILQKTAYEVSMSDYLLSG